jgi:uncharacterized protein
MSSFDLSKLKRPGYGLHQIAALCVVLLVLLIAAGCSSSGQTQAGAEGQDPDTISVTGMGTVLAAPDEAVLIVSVETEGDQAAPTADENARQMQDVVDRLRQEGLSDEALETAAVNVYPIHEMTDGRGAPRVTGYRAQNTLRVTIAETADVGRIYAAAVEAGANNIMGPEWRLSDDSVAVQEALAKAVGVARGKADALAEAAGVSVGRVVKLREDSASFPMYDTMERAAAEDMDGVAQPPIQEQQLTVTATVNVVFQLGR